MPKFNEKIFIIILIVITLINGFFWNLKSFGQSPTGDALYFNQVAENILDGKGFTFAGQVISDAPGYPLFLAGVYGILGRNSYDAARVVQILLIVASVIILYKLASKFFGKRVAVLSSLLMAVFYVFPLSAAYFERENFIMLWLLIFVYLLYQAHFRKEKRWFIFSAVSLGVLVLSNGITQLLFIPIAILLFFLYKNSPSRKEEAIRIIIFLISFFIVIGPWMLNNYKNSLGATVDNQRGYMLAIRAEIMENLYKDYGEHFIGHTLGYYFAQKLDSQINILAPRKHSSIDQRVKELLAKNDNLIEAYNTVGRDGLKKIVANPHKYLLSSLLDFISFNSPLIPHFSTGKQRMENSWTLTTFVEEGQAAGLPDFAKIVLLLGLRFIWLFSLFLVIYGTVRAIKEDWRKVIWILVIIIYFNLAYSAIHALPRYAMPIYPLYMILFSIGLFSLLNKFNFPNSLTKFYDVKSKKNQ